MLKIISLGFGVQSFTLAAMAALGELEPVDAAIFADTRHESADTYAFKALWSKWLEARGVRVVTVSAPENRTRIRQTSGSGNLYTLIPAYTLRLRDLKGGRLRRQCTSEWKIAPANRWIREELKRRGVKIMRNGAEPLAEKWLGISMDELERTKPDRLVWIKTRWPLIERRMSRHNCEQWLLTRGLEIPPKSACVFCPFSSRARWYAMSEPDRLHAIEADAALRDVRASKGIETFIHRARQPLPEILAGIDSQTEWISDTAEECSGHCFT